MTDQTSQNYERHQYRCPTELYVYNVPGTFPYLDVAMYLLTEPQYAKA